MNELLFNIDLLLIIFIADELLKDFEEVMNEKDNIKYDLLYVFLFECITIPLFFILAAANYPKVMTFVTSEWSFKFISALGLGAIIIALFSIASFVWRFAKERKQKGEENKCNGMK